MTRALKRLFRSAPWPERVDRGPSHVWIEPTTRCNTRCVHCAHYYDDFGSDMPEELARKALNVLSDDTRQVDLIGYGEPFLAERFDAMLDEILNRGIRVLTCSNGILLRDPERVARLARRDIILCLSIDGARRETFERVRPYILWERMIETLECIRRCADEAGDACRLELRFNFVPMRDNIDDLPELVRLAARYGAREIVLFPLSGQDVFERVRGQSLDDAPERLTAPCAEALRLASRLGVRLTLPASFRDLMWRADTNAQSPDARPLRRRLRKAFRAALYLRQRGIRHAFAALRRRLAPRAPAGKAACRLPWTDTYFAADGAVHPCCILGEPLGDLAAQEWSAIWNGAPYRSLRRTIHSWNPTAQCRACPYPFGINGGDEKQYEKYFAPLRREPLSLDSSRLEFGPGFHELERHDDGRASHRWMSRSGVLTLLNPGSAQFIRLQIFARSPQSDLNPGQCRVNGGPWEPFDNSCPEITFPLPGGRFESARLEIEMERAEKAEGDIRELSLGIWGEVYLLF